MPPEHVHPFAPPPIYASPRIIIKSDLPLPIVTKHFIIRSYKSSDVKEFAKLWSTWNVKPGDVEKESDKLRIEIKAPESTQHNSRINLAVFLKKADGTEGDYFGEIGLIFTKTWPMFRSFNYPNLPESAYYAERIEGFMKFWWKLPENPDHRVSGVEYGAEELVYADVYNVKDLGAFRDAGFHQINDMGLVKWLAAIPKDITDPGAARLSRWSAQIVHLRG
jgi:hypothetical protein